MGTGIYDLHTSKVIYELKAVPYGGITLPWRVNDQTISQIYYDALGDFFIHKTAP